MQKFLLAHIPRGLFTICNKEILMKKSLYLLLTLPLFTHTAILPQEAVDDINQLEALKM